MRAWVTWTMCGTLLNGRLPPRSRDQLARRGYDSDGGGGLVLVDPPQHMWLVMMIGVDPVSRAPERSVDGAVTWGNVAA